MLLDPNSVQSKYTQILTQNRILGSIQIKKKIYIVKEAMNNAQSTTQEFDQDSIQVICDFAIPDRTIKTVQ